MSTASRPTLFLIHALGSSAREWDKVTQSLGTNFDTVALDLPGFGEAHHDDGTSVEAMVDWLADKVRRRAPDAWMVVGHSMGGKLATLLTHRVEAGEVGLSSLVGVVLVAASPPSPEPMDEERREEMMGWFSDGGANEEQAGTFVDANTASRLPNGLRSIAMADVRRSSREAWLAWLERGSREDWSWSRQKLRTPTLIVAGAEDGDLGEAAQRSLNVPLYEAATVETIADAAHLIPFEQPERLAALIAAHWSRVAGRVLPAEWSRILASPRVSARTRAALIARIDDPAPDAPTCLDDRQLAVLGGVIERVLPGAGTIDIARRLDASLLGPGDGWRFADLPPDVDAWRRGLDTLDTTAGGFVSLDAHAQDDWLRRVEAGKVGADAAHLLDGGQMRLWFEDVRAEAVKVWLSHPATMARIGYDGIANGGDGVRKQGFVRLGADDVEAWEPMPQRKAR